MTESLNVLGTKLQDCSFYPLTGYFRDGCCKTSSVDTGSHVICARVTKEFLEFSRSLGNDLVTPRPSYGFPGLQAGDQWCLCAMRWKEAFDAGVAPPVILECTHQKALQFVTLAELKILFQEGRATLCRRPAKDGLDFARAVAGLGVDRPKRTGLGGDE